MPAQDPQRLKSYIEMISNKKDLERILAKSKAAAGGGLEGMESPEAGAARSGLETVLRDKDPSGAELDGLEALIIPELRPAIDIIGGKFKATHELWTHLSTDDNIRGNIERALPSVGRIELPGNSRLPYGGTGFVVGKNLLMTNRHVAAIFASGLGTRSVAFKPQAEAGIDFLRELGGPAGSVLTVRRVVMIHPYWDMAILEVENLPAAHEPLKLSVEDFAERDKEEIAVVGYPAFDPRNDAAEQDKVMARQYGVKRLQPGQLHKRGQTESFGKLVPAAVHDCSTLGGNSGSFVLHLATGNVMALHFGGRYHDKNYSVPMSELARDGRVVDAGLNFVGQAAGGVPPWSDWWEKADLVEAVEPEKEPTRQSPALVAATNAVKTTDKTTAKTTAGTIATTKEGDGVTIEIPLQITVRLGTPGTAVSAGGGAQVEAVAAEGGDIIEAMVEPEHDTKFETRTGYDPQFLGPTIEIPQPRDPNVIAAGRKGEKVFHYQNFSIIMNAERRLAHVTASNVTADPKLKKPDLTKEYTRKALSGLGNNDQERWFLDPRLDDKFQLPDVFFTRDNGAFDKGHIVRREDVNWGTTFKLVVRANGDTYHVTNCSPQVAEYNQSARGIENWGDLENHVLTSAASERLAQFAGPVLDPDDRVFVGAGGGKVKIRARIPARFWKVIISKTEEGLAAFGFVLEQDLSDVEFEEFLVPPEFAPHMFPLTDIADMAGVDFPKVVLDADQFETVRGSEVALHAGTKRKRRKKKT
jgi:endonuclease G